MDNNTERDAIAQVVQEEFRKIQEKGETPPPPEDLPVSLNINNQNYTFKNRAELESALSQTFSTFNKEISDRDSRLQTAQNAPPKQGSYVSGKEDEGFNQEEYINLMGKDILKANDYLLNYQIFGGKVPNASAALKQRLQDVEKQNATVAVYQFKELHPEFPMNEQATKVIDGLRQELGQGFTLQGLEAAYGVAQARGLLPSPQVGAYRRQLIEQGQLQDDSQGAPPQTQRAPNLGFQPPPGVSRTAPAPATDLAAQAENMSLQELSTALRKAGLL